MSTQIQNLTDADFQSVINSATVPVLVDFWAPWCKPCAALNPIMEQLAVEYSGRALVAKVNYDESPKIVAQFGIRGVPNVMLFVKGKKQAGMISVQPKSSYTRLLDNALIEHEGNGADALIDMLKDPSYREALLATGDLDELRRAVKSNPEIVSQPFENGMTPIAAVMRRRNMERIEAVLSGSPDLSVRELAGLGRLEALQQSVRDNADLVDRADVDGATPLSMAIMHGQLQCAEFLLESGANPEGDVEFENYKPLAIAVATGNLDAVKLLVTRGANVDAKTGRGQSILHRAYNVSLSPSESFKEIVEFLLDNNINKTAIDDEGKTAIESLQNRLSRYINDDKLTADDKADMVARVDVLTSLLVEKN